jgi:deltex
LNYNQLLVTNSYNLNSIYKKIISVNSPKQHNYSIKTNTNNNNNQLNLIQNIFLNILNKIFIQLDFKSFAMPLIGTGRNKVPLNDCILNLLETIQYFISNNNNNNNLIQSNKQIIIIDNNLETINQLVKLIDSKLTPTIATSVINNNNNNEKTCVICMDTIGSEANSYEKKLDKCGHSFCSICIDNYFNNVKKQCPICLTIYGVNYGNQPDGGTMTTSIINKSLPGYDSNSNTIQIQYSFSSGIQNVTHPNPGKPYSGTMRTAYLPDSLEGRKVLVLLKKSFDLKQTFTIGMSRTTGVNNTITWNDIHHKTSIHGGPSK